MLTPQQPRSPWRRRMAVAVGAIGLFVGGVTVLHLPVGRSLLRRIGGCPVGNVSPAAIEAARMEAVRAQRGTASSPSRPALGFELDVTTVADVRAWASKHGVDCTERRESTFMQCKDVPAAKLGLTWTEGNIADVSFGFRPTTHRLVNLTATRDTTDPALAAHGMRELAATLATELGAPTSAAGDPSAAHLGAGAYHTATFSYSFRDYMASVTATRRTDARIVLHEHYLSAVD